MGRATSSTAAEKADKYFREQSERLEGAHRPRPRTAKQTEEPQAAVPPAGSAGDTGQSAGRVALEKLVLESDADAFVALAVRDPGFPFEPEALGALNVLAQQKRADFERLRTRLKTETEVRVPVLEAAMRTAAGSGGSGAGVADDRMVGRPIHYDAIMPWDEVVNGAAVLTELAGAIGAYVVMDTRQRDAVALWAAFAHTHDLRDYAPLLIVKSPMKRCGKSKLLETLARLIPKPQLMIDVKAALLPRLIEEHRPTLLIDEYDALANGDGEMAENLRGLLNSSFNRHGAVVLRLVPVPGGGWEGRQFSMWAAACIAGIGKLPDTVEDRSVIIRLVRKLVSERVKRLRGKDGGELEVLRRKIARFVADNEHALRTIEPAELAGLNDRQADAWEPLFAIAEVAGGDWPQRARAAATALCGVDEAEAQEGDNRLVLLADIRDIFAQAFPGMTPTRPRAQGGRMTALGSPPSNCSKGCTPSRSGPGALGEN
jgi:hypothetical protein